MAGEPLCPLTRAEKHYGSARVLGPISLTLRSGEILGVRGANGAGKSTLLSILAGVLTPDAGQRDCPGPVAARIGYVPQELSLYSALTGLENLMFWGLACGLPRRTAAVRSRWLLEQLELSEKGRQAVSAYSGGMKRRLHLASALMVTPRMLLLDEPTVGADTHSCQLILAMLAHLREMGCGIALISHQAGELEQVCTRILTLEGGLPIGEEGPPWGS